MATIESIKPKIGDILSFQLVNPSLLGEERTSVKVDCVVNYRTAAMIDPEIARKHTVLYSYFKDVVNNIDDPSIYSYIGVIGRNDQLEVIGIPWINPSTYRQIAGTIATIAVDNWREDWLAPTRRFFAELGANFTINKQDK